jgi:23S rRNA pseudouridine1911/1915/1917 synthase
MLAEHRVERRYSALVRGRVETDRFTIDAPLARRLGRVTVSRPGGVASSTEVEVLERLAGSTLVEARPRTGRTHQIRVHLSSVGHPVLGDRRYGGGGDDARRLGLSRPFLHARAVSFVHPATGEPISVEDPLPRDLERALETARGSSKPRRKS